MEFGPYPGQVGVLRVCYSATTACLLKCWLTAGNTKGQRGCLRQQSWRAGVCEMQGDVRDLLEGVAYEPCLVTS
jgi:hypothetical protein